MNHRHTLTRACLSEGSLKLPLTWKWTVAKPTGSVELRDQKHGQLFEGRLVDDPSLSHCRVFGLGSFYQRQGAQVGDVVLSTRWPNGCVTLELQSNRENEGQVELGNLLEKLCQSAGYSLSVHGDGYFLSSLGKDTHTLWFCAYREPFSWDAFRFVQADHFVLIRSDKDAHFEIPNSLRICQCTLGRLEQLVEHTQWDAAQASGLRNLWHNLEIEEHHLAFLKRGFEKDLEERKAFSNVLLCLSQRKTHTWFTASDLMETLNGQPSEPDLQNILDVLCKPPFGMLSPSDGGYYLRCDMLSGLGHLKMYAESLATRIENRQTPTLPKNREIRTEWA
ncbi:MAG: hypothetical protein U0Z75_04510 [Deinococcaceae bacterium]